MSEQMKTHIKPQGLQAALTGVEAGTVLQRAAVTPAPVHNIPPIVHDVLRSPGQSLDIGTRSFMESRFGHDFSGVRVHTDERAVASARSVNALAYTVGRDVVFGAGQYDTSTVAGKRLLAHELTHVVQQKRSTGHPSSIEAVDNVYERNADMVSKQVINLGTPHTLSTVARLSSIQSVLQRKPQEPQRGHQCTEHVTPARSFSQYVDLVRKAEAKLIACGHKDVEDRQHILSGIYYGADWSRDFEVEHSQMRNVGFQAYLAKSYTASDDPRSCLGCGLFLSLKGSQDVGGIDMGHTLIGMDARERNISRTKTLPMQGGTGLEIVTWLGDLGGATARLAMDREKTPSASEARYFRGTDFGAPSNLEGDIAAFIVASGSSSSVDVLSIPPGGTIADALDAYFVKGTSHTNRCQHFLELQGGVFTGGVLSNRSTVESGMTKKLEGFGLQYMRNYLLQHGRLNPLTLISPPAEKNLPGAAKDVARHFVDWLLACIRRSSSTAKPGSPKGKK